VWCDPTTAELGMPGAPVTGVESILTELRSATATVQDLRFEFTETFASGGHVIAIGSLFYTLPPEALGRTERSAHFELRVVTALEIEDGRVRAHTDYTDFSHWQEAAR
jgi:ketosteroid isomerase-like protein